jgi:hypothetical protein
MQTADVKILQDEDAGHLHHLQQIGLIGCT